MEDVANPLPTTPPFNLIALQLCNYGQLWAIMGTQYIIIARTGEIKYCVP